MEKNKFFDIINCDINILKIVRVYHKLDKKWQKLSDEKRNCQGLVLFKKGSIHYDFDGFSFEAKAGDVLKLPAGINYSGHKIGNDDNEYYVVDFITENENDFYFFPLPLAFSVKDFAQVEEKFWQIEKIWNDCAPMYKLEAKEKIYELLKALTEEYYGLKNESRTIKICRYIKENAFLPELKISDVAEKFFISEAHMRRIFKDELNISPLEFLMDIRIKKAMNLLLTKDMPICEIAECCGYHSVYYFSSAFRKKIGISCSEYRNEIRQKQLLE